MLLMHHWVFFVCVLWHAPCKVVSMHGLQPDSAPESPGYLPMGLKTILEVKLLHLSQAGF